MKRAVSASAPVSAALLRTGLAGERFMTYFQSVVRRDDGALHGLEATVCRAAVAARLIIRAGTTAMAWRARGWPTRICLAPCCAWA